MDKAQQWLALTLVAVVAVLAAGWFLLVSPKRAEAADLKAQTQAQHDAAASLRTQLAALQAQERDLPAQQAKLSIVSAKVPDDAALPALIRALTDAAAVSGVEFVSFAPSTPAPVATATAASATAAAPATSANPGEATVAAPVPVATGGVQKIAVALNVVGSYYQLEQYLGALEDLPRAMRVTSLALAPGANPVAAASAPTSANLLVATISSEVYLSGAAATTTSAASAAAAVN